MVFSTLLRFWHPKYPPETIGLTAVFMVWRAGAPPGPLLAPKWGKMWFLGHFNTQTPKNHPFHPFDPLWCRNPYIGIPYIGIPYTLYLITLVSTNLQILCTHQSS